MSYQSTSAAARSATPDRSTDLGGIVLRPATAADVEALAELERVCFRGVYAEHRWSREQIADQVGNPRGIALVAARDGRVVGYIAGISSTGTRAHIARIYSVAVAPDARRAGIGHALVERFLAEARRLGKDKVLLEVARARREARQLFEETGFVLRQELPDYYGPERHGLRMVRSFEPPGSPSGSPR